MDLSYLKSSTLLVFILHNLHFALDLSSLVQVYIPNTNVIEVSTDPNDVTYCEVHKVMCYCNVYISGKKFSRGIIFVDR